MEKDCNATLLNFRGVVYSTVKSLHRSLELSMSKGIYLITIRLLKYNYLVPVARFLREVIEDVLGRSPLIYLDDVMDAVVTTPNGCRFLQEAGVNSDGFTGRLQESGDIFRDDVSSSTAHSYRYSPKRSKYSTKLYRGSL